MKKFYFVVLFALTTFFAQAQQAFITTWEVTNNDLNISIPTEGSGYNYIIDFGDGTVQNNVTGDISHIYSAAGIYTVAISGSFPRIYFASLDYYEKRKLQGIEQWGDIQWQSMEGAFQGCNNLIVDAMDAPDLSQVTSTREMFYGAGTHKPFLFTYSINNWDVSSVVDMSGMFANAISFNQSINNWNVSNVSTMSGMFNGAESFNQPLNDWDVSNVTDMSGMFASTWLFNQPLNNWDVSNVTDMSDMFASSSYNQSISNWDVSNVTNMSEMFEGCGFNQPINTWDVSSVTDMSYMFYFADSFNQPLDNWDVSSVADMSSMFSRASSFNQALNSWNVSSVTDMASMFSGSPYNQPLNNWDVSSVTDMSGMFSGAFDFDQALNNWDVSNVTDMSRMFLNALSFNQPLNNWDVSQVIDMAAMFGCDCIDSQILPSFNQPLSDWDVSNVTEISNMFWGASAFNQDLATWQINTNSLYAFLSYSGLDVNNYDTFLAHLATLGLNNGYLGAHGLQYCDQTAHDNLFNNLGWSIDDAGLDANCNMAVKNIGLDNFFLYPNPTTGILHISSETELEQVEVFSLTGNRLLLQDKNLGEIDLHQFPGGIYLLKITDESGEEVVRKIVKK